MSHPAWVCGLKHAYQAVAERGMKSHPAWVCGLKPDVVDEPFLASKVTPCVGVWIETNISGFLISIGKSHPAWVCGLKHSLEQDFEYHHSHTLRGCVD